MERKEYCVAVPGANPSGRKLDETRALVAAKAGQGPATKMIQAAVTFEVQEIRSLAELGQSWETLI